MTVQTPPKPKDHTTELNTVAKRFARATGKQQSVEHVTRSLERVMFDFDTHIEHGDPRLKDEFGVLNHNSWAVIVSKDLAARLSMKTSQALLLLGNALSGANVHDHAGSFRVVANDF